MRSDHEVQSPIRHQSLIPESIRSDRVRTRCPPPRPYSGPTRRFSPALRVAVARLGTDRTMLLRSRLDCLHFCFGMIPKHSANPVPAVPFLYIIQLTVNKYLYFCLWWIRSIGMELNEKEHNGMEGWKIDFSNSSMFFNWISCFFTFQMFISIDTSDVN